MIKEVVKSTAIYGIGLLWAIPVLLRIAWLMISKPRKFFFRKTREYRPVCLNDPALGTHGYVRLEEIRLHYVSKGQDGKPLMLLLHGLPEFWYSWRHQLREFSRDYKVVAIDTRGYGETDKPESVSQYAMEILARDISQLVPALGYKSCILVGHDWGGAISWAVASIYPKLVDQVIVMNCPHPAVFQPYLRAHPKQFFKSWYMFFFNLPYLPDWVIATGDFKMIENSLIGKTSGAKPGAFTQEDIEAFKYNISQPGAVTSALNYIRVHMRGYSSYWNKLGHSTGLIEVPILMLWGTKDGFLESEMAEISGKYCRDYTLRYIDGASHWVQQDDPELVNNYMYEFLQK